MRRLTIVVIQFGIIVSPAEGKIEVCEKKKKINKGNCRELSQDLLWRHPQLLELCCLHRDPSCGIYLPLWHASPRFQVDQQMKEIASVLASWRKKEAKPLDLPSFAAISSHSLRYLQKHLAQIWHDQPPRCLKAIKSQRPVIYKHAHVIKAWRHSRITKMGMLRSTTS